MNHELTLTPKQIKHLRRVAHPLSAVLQTGDNGLTKAVQDEIAVALKAHELIKIKLNAERHQRDAMIAEIAATQHCHVVQYVGKTVALFKRNSNNIKILLPKI